jgi:chromosome condensin MukBEF ATPase and DNA-binding subunit MukB
MPGMMRRRVRRRAVVGTAVVAGGAVHHMNKKNAQAQADADSQAQMDDMQSQLAYQQQALDAQAAQQQAVPAAAAAPAAGGLGSSQIDQLTQLAGLRDQGILTDAEFEAQKAKILG